MSSRGVRRTCTIDASFFLCLACQGSRVREYIDDEKSKAEKLGKLTRWIFFFFLEEREERGRGRLSCLLCCKSIDDGFMGDRNDVLIV